MKKIIGIFLIIALALSITSCGFIAGKITDKAAEAVAEGIIEENSSGDVDIESGKITIEGEDGEVSVIGETDWPDTDFAKNIPEFTQGNVAAVISSEGSLWITLDTVEEADATAYLETIKSTYTLEPYEMTYEGGFTFSAKNADGLTVSLQYGDGSFIITLDAAAE